MWYQYQYIFNGCKDGKSKEFLQNSNDTIAAIGEKVGYKDTRYFSQTFAKYVGIKPMLYRKLHS